LLVEKNPRPGPKQHFDPALPVFKNLIKRYSASGRNQVWVATLRTSGRRRRFCIWV